MDCKGSILSREIPHVLDAAKAEFERSISTWIEEHDYLGVSTELLAKG